MALGLAPASKRPLGSDIPQGNIRLPRTQVVPSKLKLISRDFLLTRLRQDGLIMVRGLRLGLKVHPDQGQMSSGNGVMYCTTRPGSRSNGPRIIPRTPIIKLKKWLGGGEKYGENQRKSTRKKKGTERGKECSNWETKVMLRF